MKITLLIGGARPNALLALADEPRRRAHGAGAHHDGHNKVEGKGDQQKGPRPVRLAAAAEVLDEHSEEDGQQQRATRDVLCVIDNGRADIEGEDGAGGERGDAQGPTKKLNLHHPFFFFLLLQYFLVLSSSRLGVIGERLAGCEFAPLRDLFHDVGAQQVLDALCYLGTGV
jgi:hypothetical protein